MGVITLMEDSESQLKRHNVGKGVLEHENLT